MYESASFFDPNSMTEDAANGFLQPVDDDDDDDDAVVAFNGESFNPDAHLIHNANQLLSYEYDHSKWDTQQIGHQEQDLLNLLHLPRCTSSPFTNPNHMIPLGFSGDLPSSSNWLFDSNMPPQPPLSGAWYEDGSGAHFNNFVPDEFNGDSDMACIGRRGKAGKEKKPIISERQRRVEMNDKFKVLKSLVPSSNSKTDRASVVGDACEYIKELQRTVNELKLLVEKKRFARDDMKPFVDTNASSRSSWLQRKSKDAEVDVRIIDNEVTIKLVQRKKMDCLLVVSKVLDELQLDLQHVAGGQIGDYSSFLFNTKIYDGSCVYAGAVAHKLIEVMDYQYAAVPKIDNCSY